VYSTWVYSCNFAVCVVVHSESTTIQYNTTSCDAMPLATVILSTDSVEEEEEVGRPLVHNLKEEHD
jgi:hypothetical protein